MNIHWASCGLTKARLIYKLEVEPKFLGLISLRLAHFLSRGKVDFWFAILFSSPKECRKKILCQARKKEEEHDPPNPGIFFEIFEPWNPRFIWKIFAKRNKSFREFLKKKLFFEVFILAVEKCPSFRFYFSDNFSI